jgi:predicted nucleic acid-binding protein
LPLRADLAHLLEDSLAHRRVAVDVSVLLAGLLDTDSPSQRLLGLLSKGTTVLSDHVEERARLVLKVAAPHLLPEFNDQLLRFSTKTHLERVTADGAPPLPSWTAAGLSAEDARVLAGAIAGQADYLFTHDRDFFQSPIAGLSVESPASFVWDALDGANVKPGTAVFTFLGVFFPNWSTEAVAGSDEQFFVFEVANHINAFYDARSSAYHVRWHKRVGARKGIALPARVDAASHNFIAVIADEERVTLFVNGSTAGRNVRLGPARESTTFYPFANALQTSQINGGCKWRVVDTALSLRTVRRHYDAHSLELTDGELKFAEWAGRSHLLVSPNDVRLIAPPT